MNSRRPDGVEDPASFAYYLERSLTAEQFARPHRSLTRRKSKKSGIAVLFRKSFWICFHDRCAMSKSSVLSNSPACMICWRPAKNQASDSTSGRNERQSSAGQRAFGVMFTVLLIPGNHAVQAYLKNEVEPPSLQVAWSMFTSRGVQVQPLTESLQLEIKSIQPESTANDRTCVVTNTPCTAVSLQGAMTLRSVDGSFSGLFSIPARGKLPRQERSVFCFGIGALSNLKHGIPSPAPKLAGHFRHFTDLPGV